MDYSLQCSHIYAAAAAAGFSFRKQRLRKRRETNCSTRALPVEGEEHLATSADPERRHRARLYNRWCLLVETSSPHENKIIMYKCAEVAMSHETLCYANFFKDMINKNGINTFRFYARLTFFVVF